MKPVFPWITSFSLQPLLSPYLHLPFAKCPVASPLFVTCGSLSPVPQCHQLTGARQGEQHPPKLSYPTTDFHKIQQNISNPESFSSLSLFEMDQWVEKLFRGAWVIGLCLPAGSGRIQV